ncbi:MAG: hypothetical protein P8Q14_09790 [Vicingaceae bacterium]|nr:hypothetical protein [Vicingaceae bacterium]
MEEMKTYPTSEEGFNNRLALIIITSIFFILFETIGISMLISQGVWKISVFGGGIILLIGLLLINLFPRTHSICVLDNDIEVSNKTELIMIPFTDIKSIRASFAMIDQNFHHLEYYRIDLKKPCKFGTTIYFRKRNSNYLSRKKTVPIEKIIKAKIIKSKNQ